MNHLSPPPAPSRVIVHLNWVDAVTLGGLLLALGALLATGRHHLELALGLLFLAVFCDAFDGVLARRYGLARDFGRYLDSFVDVFIYLITPAAWFYATGFDTPWALAILAVFISAGLIRLSVFNGIGNIEISAAGSPAKLAYLGMPVFWAAFIAAGYFPLRLLAGSDLAQPVLGVVLLVYAALMLHRADYWKPRHKGLMLGAIGTISATYFWLAA
ncbi:CDP-alcohol phosphatidyltransferase family protein [Sphingomonas sp. CJ20]